MFHAFSTRIVLLVSIFTTASQAAEIVLPAAKDNTLYESSAGRQANGAGQFLFAGRTGQSSRSIRRTLLQFDLSDIPSNSVITGAELQVTVSQAANSAPLDATLHRLVSNWSEGVTDAPVSEGAGDDAADGDATWLHTSKPDGLWTTPGGDFLSVATQTLAVGGEGEIAWGLGDELINDVQLWLDSPDDNFGWAILGNEQIVRTAKRFNSRTHPDLSSRPSLLVQYEVVPEPSYEAMMILALSIFTASRRKALR